MQTRFVTQQSLALSEPLHPWQHPEAERELCPSSKDPVQSQSDSGGLRSGDAIAPPRLWTSFREQGPRRLLRLLLAWKGQTPSPCGRRVENDSCLHVGQPGKDRIEKDSKGSFQTTVTKIVTVTVIINDKHVCSARHRPEQLSHP